MADQFRIIPPTVIAAGTDVPPEQIQAGFNSIAFQTTTALNSVASDPSGPASGDLGGTYPAPTVVAVHATGGTLDGVVIGGTTPAAATVTTLTANTPIAVTSGGTGANALNAHNVIIGEGSSTVAFAAPGTAGQILASNGATVDPSFQTKTALTIASSGANTDITSLNAPALGAATATTAAAGNSSTLVATTAFLTAPGPIGSTTANTGAFTTLSASSTVSGTGFTNRFASPGPIGSTAASTGAFTTLSSTGTFTPSSTNGIVGTTAADNANAGSVGEYATNTATGASLTSGTTANAVSVSLTAGDWDVSGIATVIGAGGAVISQRSAGISTTSATLPGSNTGGFTQWNNSSAASAAEAIPSPTVRVSLSATTTVFLVTQVSFTPGTCSANGFIRARRVR